MRNLIVLLFLFSCGSMEQSKNSAPKAPQTTISNKTASYNKLMNTCKTDSVKADLILKKKQKTENKSAAFWGLAANCHVQSNNISQALLDLKIGSAIDSKNSSLKEARALIFMKNKNYAQAYEILDSINHNASTNALVKLAKLENYFGNHSKSNGYITRAISDVDLKTKNQLLFLAARNDIANENYISSINNFKNMGLEATTTESRRLYYSYSLAKNGNIPESEKLIIQRQPASSSKNLKIQSEIMKMIQEYKAKNIVKKEVPSGSTIN